ncbi:MAG: flagellar biosynthetic protein FliO [Sandaracinaceae bacterium]|nr:flagellar biosynthetic protein FliO [Sandaracinaceae bacterium]
MQVWLQAAPAGYGVALLQTLLALAAVCILAWVVLRWSARRGLGHGTGRRVKVLERVPLDGRRALYLVEVGGRVLLLGAGEGAAPAVLAELALDELPEVADPKGFGELVARLRGAAPKEPPA